MIRLFFKKYFSDKSREFIRNLIKSCRAFWISDNLLALSQLYGTDKGSLGYTPIYSFFLHNIRYRVHSVLEIGIGGGSNPKSGGGSLKMWSKYFPNATILGIDIFDKSFFNFGRIETKQGDQTDIIFLKSLYDEKAPWDIIIDDGSHICKDVILTFETLFPLLKSGGIYFVEDTMTSYWEEYGGDSEALNNPKTTLNYFKSLVDSMHHSYIRNQVSHLKITDIEAIHFYPKFIAIRKK